MKQTKVKNEKVIMLLSNPCLIDPRVENEALSLAGSGCEVQIVAWDRLCNNKPVEHRNNFKIVRISSRSSFSKGISQIFGLLKFYFKAYKYIRGQGSVKIIHCNDLDTLPLGYFYKSFNKVKLVYDAHEIYSEMAFKNSILKKMAVSIEKMLIKKADLFFTVGRIRLEWYNKNNYEKLPVILGNYKEKSKAKINIASERKKLGINNKILILYIGSLNAERMITELIEAVKNDKRFVLYIAGNGTQKIKIISSLDKTSNVKYLGFIGDHEKIDYYNKICNVIYYGLYPGNPVSQTSVPNKMFEAVAYDKVFLCSKIGEMNIIKDNPFVFISDLKQNLDQVYKLSKNQKLRKKVTEKNRALNKKFNFKVFKKILLENYRGLSS